jgi:hypothetical protein
MRKQTVRKLCLAGAAVCVLLSCRTTQSLKELVESIPAKNLEYYDFSPMTDVAQRLNVSSDVVMSYLDEYDNPNGDYMLYEPTVSERTLFGEYLELLPDRYQTVMAERLVGIYFVENFISSGMTDYVLSESNEVYVTLVLNPIVFDKKLSELLTYKENTIYRADGNDAEVKIEVTGDYSGLLYILAHECTHIIDYVDRITPYVEPGINILLGENKKAAPFTKAHWLDYYEPIDPVEYGDSLRFYSTDEDQKIPATVMADVYTELESTPFVSLYSYLSWAEDLAEYCTMFHFTQHLGLSYTIRVLEEGKIVFEYEPFTNPRILKRGEALDFL